MKCQDLLSRLETCGPIKRLLARRHVRGCPECAAVYRRWTAVKNELAQAEPLSPALRNLWAGAVKPAGAVSRVGGVQAVVSAQPARRGRPLAWTAAAAWKRIFNRGREIMRRPMPRFAAAAATCLAAVVVWSLFLDHQPNAYADFAKAVAQARSVTFEVEVMFDGKPAPEHNVRGYYLAPGKLRIEREDADGIETVDIHDLVSGRNTVLKPEKKTATTQQIDPQTLKQRNDRGDVFALMQDLLSQPGEASEKFKPIGERVVNGVRALGFRKSSEQATETLWGDPATGLPVLVQIEQEHVTRTASNFKLNEDLKPELFDTTPPEGYTVVRAAEESFVASLHIVADLNDGAFLDDLEPGTVLAWRKRAAAKPDGSEPPAAEQDELTNRIIAGMTFAVLQPEFADAHYAGKGVKRDEPNRPIFWYKSGIEEKYRVVYADLTVKDADSAPVVAGAIRMPAVAAKAERGTGAGGALTAEDLARLAEHRALNAIKASYVLTQQSHGRAAGGPGMGGGLIPKNETKALIELTGQKRFLVDQRHAPHRSNAKPLETLVAWDSQTYVRWRNPRDWYHEFASIDNKLPKKGENADLPGTDPLLFSCLLYPSNPDDAGMDGGALLSWLREGSVHKELEEIDGRRCCVVERYWQGRALAWLDVERSLAPVKIQMFRKNGALVQEHYAEDFVEFFGGGRSVWLPMHVEINIYVGQEIVTRSISVDRAETSINPTISAASFQIEFPEGTRVHDEVSKTRK
jgi:outer membrane lipoprotein-sorting protein